MAYSSNFETTKVVIIVVTEKISYIFLLIGGKKGGGGGGGRIHICNAANMNLCVFEDLSTDRTLEFHT